MAHSKRSPLAAEDRWEDAEQGWLPRELNGLEFTDTGMRNVQKRIVAVVMWRLDARGYAGEKFTSRCRASSKRIGHA